MATIHFNIPITDDQIIYLIGALQDPETYEIRRLFLEGLFRDKTYIYAALSALIALQDEKSLPVLREFAVHERRTETLQSLALKKTYEAISAISKKTPPKMPVPALSIPIVLSFRDLILFLPHAIDVRKSYLLWGFLSALKQTSYKISAIEAHDILQAKEKSMNESSVTVRGTDG